MTLILEGQTSFFKGLSVVAKLNKFQYIFLYFGIYYKKKKNPKYDNDVVKLMFQNEEKVVLFRIKF